MHSHSEPVTYQVPWRDWSGVATLPIATAVCAFAAYGAHWISAEAPILGIPWWFPWAVTLVAPLAAAAISARSLGRFLNTTTFHVTPDEVRVRHGPIPLWLGTTLSRQHIRSVRIGRVTKLGQGRTRESRIWLEARTGREVAVPVVGSPFEGSLHAEALAALLDVPCTTDHDEGFNVVAEALQVFGQR